MSNPRRAAIGWWLVLLIAGLAAAAQLGAHATADVGWYLYVARQVLHGAEYGVDILEINPPFIVWLKVPAVAAAELFGAREATMWSALVTLLTAGSIGLSRSVLPAATPAAIRGLPGIAVAAAAMLLLPGGDFGQREHVTVVLALPYLVVAGRRLAGDQVRHGVAALAGALGCLGLMIKPYFVLVLIAVVGLHAARLGFRRIFLPEHVTLVATGLLYLLLIWLATPEYWGYAIRYGPLYRRFLELSPWTVAVTGEGILPGYVALAAYAGLRRRMAAAERPLVDALAVATVAFQLAGIAQEKGWRYHFLPAMTCASALGAVLVAGSRVRLTGALDRVYHAMTAGMLGALLAAPLPTLGLRLASPRHPALTGELSLDLLLPMVRAVGPDGYVALFSTNVASAFPLVQESGARWAYRQLSLWPILSLYHQQLAWGRKVHPRAQEERGALEIEFARATMADLERTRPALLLVMIPDSAVSGWGAARLFDYLEHFDSVPGFREFLAQYRRAGIVGTYQVYTRLSAPSAPAIPPPGRDRLEHTLRQRHRLDRWTERFMIAGILAGALAAWLLAPSRRQS